MIRVSRRAASRLPGPLLVVLACLCAPVEQVSAQDEGADPVGMAVDEAIRVRSDGRMTLRPFLVSGSIQLWIDGRSLDQGEFVVDEVAGHVLLKPGAFSAGDIVRVHYRVFALDLPTVFRLSREAREIPAAARPTGPSPGLRPSAQPGGLRTRGAVTRGVLAGTGRDVSIESGLRLDVEGEPARGVRVAAVLTDESTPIRPDGSTQRLDEFDRVAIRLETNRGAMRLGDFEMRLQGGRYGQFRRSLQGAGLEASLPLPGSSSLHVQGAGAASRGIFRTQTVQPVDGVQGPYRLEGRSGEQFILLVPGSEVVYMDGERLDRGVHYVVDYGTGELTFTGERLVTADRRISVEFTYSLNQFTRTLAVGSGDAGFWNDASGRPRAHIGISWMQEADGGQFLEEFGLSSADSLVLAGAGDGGANRSGAIEVEFDPEAPYVQYRKEVRGSDTVYVALDRSPALGESVFRVRFSRVAAGTGKYARSGQSVNGVAYIWSPGGDYDAVRPLPAPSLRRLFDVRMRVNPVAWGHVEAEWARSSVDLNRLSTLDADDDAGGAGRVAAHIAHGRIAAHLLHERVEEQFSAFDRFRSVEFGREWNLEGRLPDALGGMAGGEVRTSAGLEARLLDSTRVSGEWSRLTIGTTFEGSRWVVDGWSREAGRPHISWSGQGVVTDDALLSPSAGSFVSGRIRMAAPSGATLRPYVELEGEERTLPDEDGMLRPASISFFEARPGLAWARGAWAVSAEVERRGESWPDAARLLDAATSWTARTSVRRASADAWRGGLSVAWRRRDMEPLFAGRAGADATRALLLAADGEGRWADRMRISWQYEARTERTPRLQEVYFRTGPERGEFVWEDANGDGIVQVDEFLPETTPDEGLYVRTFLPSDSLLPVSAVRAAVRIVTDAAASGLLSIVSGQTVFEVDERSRTDHRAHLYLLRLGRFREEGQTLDGRLRLRQDISLFRGRRGFGADLSYRMHRSLSELSAGLESASLDAFSVSMRARTASGPEWGLSVGRDHNRTDSRAFSSRRFDIVSTSLSPSVRWRPSPGSTVRLAVDAARKEDANAARRADLVRLPVHVRLSKPGAADLAFRFEAAWVELVGEASGLAAWELTEGRGPGTSFLWGATVQWSMGRMLKATLSYDGRAPSGRPVIHTGRLELSAIF